MDLLLCVPIFSAFLPRGMVIQGRQGCSALKTSAPANAAKNVA